MLYFEDIEIGRKTAFGRYAVTRDEVIEFATKYDPQPFHLDDDAAAKTFFGKIAASGWHTCAMMMRMMADNMKDNDHAGLGSPGVDELRWLKPVYPGDVLRCETEVIEKTASKSRPEMGSFRSLATVLNQHDEPVLSFVSIGLVRKRPEAG